MLGSAAARGVKVRVLADACGSWSTKRKFWRKMQGMGIEARLFHPFWSNFRNILFRDHRKIIVIDRLVSFTGGMNVANEYGLLRRHRGHPFRDTHIRVEGAAAWEMALVFGEGWERSGGASLHQPPHVRTNIRGVRTLVLILLKKDYPKIAHALFLFLISQVSLTINRPAPSYSHRTGSP